MTLFAIVFFTLPGAVLLTRTGWILLPTALRFAAACALVATARQGHGERALVLAGKTPPSVEAAKLETPPPPKKGREKKSRAVKPKRRAGYAVGLAALGAAVVTGAGVVIYSVTYDKP